jgi:hypothetical protein
MSAWGPGSSGCGNIGVHLEGHGLCCLRAAELMRLADEHVQVVDDSFELLCETVSDDRTEKSRG